MAEHSDETRAAVLASLMTGQSVNQVAKEFSIPRSTITRWKQTTGMESGHVGPQKSERIGELVIEYLTEGLTTLVAQHRVFRDERWLKRQHAESLAVLHGVLADKTYRILAALQPEDGNGGGRS